MALDQGAAVIRLAPPAPAVPGAGVIRIPCTMGIPSLRIAPLTWRDRFFDPTHWQLIRMAPDPADEGWFVLDVDALALPDGDYEYDLQLGPDRTVPDPFAEEIVRFGGYRSVLHVRGGKRWRPEFSWDGELSPRAPLARNHELIIYEVPLRWMDKGDQEQLRQVGLGTFDKMLFEHLDEIEKLGVNAIELLPIHDSADTLNWGYGSRFFFAPDLDMGAPVDVKLLVKACHQRGIRVILDVVMNHSRECPFAVLARRLYYAPEDKQDGRDGWGGNLFWYDTPVDGHFPARELHLRMGEFWIREYHIDGYRIDEFKSIKNWDFVQHFRDRATAMQQSLFPGRPFVVIAEDSGRNAVITQDTAPNPGGRRTADAAWNFSFQEEVRALLTDKVQTAWGNPSRSDRIRAALSARGALEGYSGTLRPGFTDMAQAINYVVSHDVEAAPRFVNLVLEQILARMGVDRRDWQQIRDVVDQVPSDGTPGVASNDQRRAAREEALDRAAGPFALLLTSVGIPMFLAGEEFGDAHDGDYTKWRLKASDPVNFARQRMPGNAALLSRVKSLVALRRTHPALLRNEIDFFYFHPRIDDSGAERVFAYCRTAAMPLGSKGQVIVIANLGPQNYPEFVFPRWPWASLAEHGVGARGTPVRIVPGESRMSTSLAPFEVRVFSS